MKKYNLMNLIEEIRAMDLEKEERGKIIEYGFINRIYEIEKIVQELKRKEEEN